MLVIGGYAYNYHIPDDKDSTEDIDVLLVLPEELGEAFPFREIRKYIGEYSLEKGVYLDIIGYVKELPENATKVTELVYVAPIELVASEYTRILKVAKRELRPPEVSMLEVLLTTRDKTKLEKYERRLRKMEEKLGKLVYTGPRVNHYFVIDWSGII